MSHICRSAGRRSALSVSRTMPDLTVGSDLEFRGFGVSELQGKASSRAKGEGPTSGCSETIGIRGGERRSREPPRRGQSARRSSAVGVRAAIRPGRAATTFARTSAPTATRAIDSPGTVGAGTA